MSSLGSAAIFGNLQIHPCFRPSAATFLQYLHFDSSQYTSCWRHPTMKNTSGRVGDTRKRYDEWNVYFFDHLWHPKHLWGTLHQQFWHFPTDIVLVLVRVLMLWFEEFLIIRKHRRSQLFRRFDVIDKSVNKLSDNSHLIYKIHVYTVYSKVHLL